MMSARFESSGVGPTDITLHIFDEHLTRRLSPDPATVKFVTAEILDDADYADAIEKLGVDKPDWFLAMESDARTFMGKHGFYVLPPIYLLREGEELKAIDMYGTPDAVALTEAFDRYALVRQKSIEKLMQSDGIVKAASVLVHELTHLTGKNFDITLYKSNTEPQIESFGTKAGFVFGNEKISRGVFLEEALAAFMAGWYVRTKQGESSPLSIKDRPLPHVPDHYRFKEDGIASFGGDMIAGPDGYALEMIMWAAQQSGIMQPEPFVEDLLATRDRASQAYALRNVITTINAIQPDLYAKLSRLEYSKRAWEEGCALVYEAVTGNLWPGGASEL